MQLIRLIESTGVSDWKQLQPKLPGNAKRTDWKNIGGQLIPEPAIQSLIRSVRQGKINDWDEVHAFYKKESTAYPVKKFQQSFAALLEIQKLSVSRFTRKTLVRLLGESIRTKEWMTTGIYESRAKDYRNPFRKMVYDTEAEMEKVIGKLKDNSFILQQQEELKAFRKQVTELIRLFSK
jgi:hypothetical protein